MEEQVITNTKPLTTRQKMVLDAIREYKELHQMIPTTRELAARFGCAQNNINNLINTLVSKGKLMKHSKKARSLILVDENL